MKMSQTEIIKDEHKSAVKINTSLHNKEKRIYIPLNYCNIHCAG